MFAKSSVVWCSMAGTFLDNFTRFRIQSEQPNPAAINTNGLRTRLYPCKRKTCRSRGRSDSR